MGDVRFLINVLSVSRSADDHHLLPALQTRFVIGPQNRLENGSRQHLENLILSEQIHQRLLPESAAAPEVT